MPARIADYYDYYFSPNMKIKRMLLKLKNANAKSIRAVFLRKRMFYTFHITIGRNSRYGEGLFFPHPQNIVIGEGVVIGYNVTIYQNVTLGAKRDKSGEMKYPVLGNNVVIFPGAIVVGGVAIGDGVVIGANSFVNKNFPPGVIIAGTPAEAIARRE
jgi:serine O-acetyltransferase